jgi:hypothetical protein
VVKGQALVLTVLVMISQTGDSDDGGDRRWIVVLTSAPTNMEQLL